MLFLCLLYGSWTFGYWYLPAFSDHVTFTAKGNQNPHSYREKGSSRYVFFFFFLMAVCLHAAAHCKSLKGHQHRNASQFTPTKGKKDGDFLSHIHSYPFSLLLYSTSSTRMLAVALIRAVNQWKKTTTFISVLLSRFKLIAYTPKDECNLWRTLSFYWLFNVSEYKLRV